MLKVTTGGDVVCGEVLSADHGRIQLKVAGEESPRTIALDRVENLAAAMSCS
ncbi:MAG: hypothetical protein IPK24_22760 [Kineosporiaceae bacterium]|nr:hypothetical protein [Kineosporiaceae bacterium]